MFQSCPRLSRGKVIEWPPQRGLPVCRRADGSLVMYIVHLFSGRRRQGDCHDWVAKLSKEYFEDIDVIILSIDTAVGGDKCDLLHGEGLASLKRFVALGLATASLSGPPCETWSAARHLSPPAGCKRRWPRPLRSAAAPWGLEALSYRELTQLSTGSALMTSNVSIEAEIVLNDGASIMEHPAPHSNPDYASVWRTALQRVICGGAPGFQLLEVEQWRYGAQAVKPTTLRLMGLPPSAEILHDSALPGVTRPVATLAGLDGSTGLFNTAKAKEYPSGFCKAIVTTLFAGLSHRLRDQGMQVRNFSQLEERYVRWLQAVETASSSCSATTFLPDYQPQR